MAARPPVSDPSGASRRPVGPARRLLLLVTVLVVLLLAAAVGYRVGRSAPSADGPLPVPSTLKAQPVDVGFAMDMIDHHDQAVQMALLALNGATTQPVRSLATSIVADQRREMGILDQFLRDRGVTSVDRGRTVMAWMGEPTPHDQMPGLATTAQIVALTNATGPEVDRLFIDLMLEHHRGGVHMAEYAAEHAESQEIRDLAARMATAQNHEITDLTQLRES